MSQSYTKGIPISTDPTMSANSDQVVPSQAAVVAYVTNSYINPWKIDYDSSITGIKNGVNVTFSTSLNFQTGTLKVYLNGLLLTPGALYDYIVISSNTFQMNYPPDSGELLIAEYMKL